MNIMTDITAIIMTTAAKVKNIIITIMRSIIAAISMLMLPKKRTNITAAMRMKQVRTIIMNTEILTTSKLSLKIQI